MQALPEITLNTTLGDLYARGNQEKSNKRIAMVLCAANSEVAPTSRLARNTKYLYQDSTFSTTPESSSAEQQREIQRSLAIKYLSLVPQHDAFAAGNMPVILFNLDGSEGNTTRSKEEAKKTIRNLTASQRLNLLFFPGPRQILMEQNEIDLLAAKMEFDELEGFPLVVDLDTHYYLNSKAALCTSGLPRYASLNKGFLPITTKKAVM